ncbi:hypothetical protein JST97_05615 [bacterium]|nr:hypothetical protein [bacterium]
MAQADCKSLNDYLATFYEGAQLDSTGQFSLDLVSRARKTAAFQLAQPELFVIPLMMAAWLGGSRRFELIPHVHGFDLSFDGTICASDEITQVQGCLENRLPDPAQDRLRHLHLALRLARELNVDLISLEIPNSPGLAWVKGDLQLESPGQVQRLSLRQRQNPLARLFGSRLIKIRETVRKVIASRSLLSRAWQPGLARLDIGRTDGHGSLGCLLPQDSSLSGQLALLGWAEPSQAWFVHHGVLFPMPLPRRSLRLPYRLLLDTPQAVPDLSYSRLIENESMQSLLRLIPGWLGELDWAYLLLSNLGSDAAAEVCWDMRQRALHGVAAPRVEWAPDSGVVEASRLAQGRNFHQAARAYSRLQYLPVCLDPEAPPELDSGSALFIKPSGRDEILDRTYPRQQEFVCWDGRAVPLEVSSYQLLLESEFLQISRLRDGLQLGLNLQPQRYPGTVWLYEVTASIRLRALGPGTAPAGLPVGVTLATTGPVQNWEVGLQEALRQAWLDPRTEQDRTRHSLVLEHWLLAAANPKLRDQLELSSAWAWNQQGKQVFLSDLRPGQIEGLLLSAAVQKLLPVIWR